MAVPMQHARKNHTALALSNFSSSDIVRLAIESHRRLCSRIQAVCMLVSTACSLTRASPATNTFTPPAALRVVMGIRLPTLVRILLLPFVARSTFCTLYKHQVQSVQN
jgi:hypothetical protein